MKVLRMMLGAACLLAPIFAQETVSQQKGKAPFMVSFSDLKWVALPDREGMQYALLSGDPKTGAYMQIRKVPAGTDNPLHSHSSEITNVIINGIWYTGPNSSSAKDFGSRFGDYHAGRLGPREWLPPRQRVRVLPARQRKVRL